ncbi:hypothetical protein H6P81_001144 [Aristolochia fimbriata]|uniref:CW-type domain-containing protein n=1 Tax=Aristolochia fimbriata TaxID=158543 RepID=A0AAV7F7B4_ARIFI|nr:hypothetical protein H6P81_001144 [Aristolochia fimbriata]
MGHRLLNLNEPPVEGGGVSIMLQKDTKPISRVKCINPPDAVPCVWNITEIRTAETYPVAGLPRCFVRPASENYHQKREWGLFVGFLRKHKRVAHASSEECDLYILPPVVDEDFSQISVAYQEKKGSPALNHPEDGLKDDIPQECNDGHKSVSLPSTATKDQRVCMYSKKTSSDLDVQHPSTSQVPFSCGQDVLREDVAESSAANCRGAPSVASASKLLQKGHSSKEKDMPRCVDSSVHNLADISFKKNYMRTDPSYLVTLSHTHSGWIFGAIAELVDNSRDAKALSLLISVESFYSKQAVRKIPVLCVIDDGHGMPHSDIVRMLSFGHKQPDECNRDYIGRFGIGFKSGAMRLGQDAIVLTQNDNSRSVALLSQSYNKGKDNLEIPIVSYRREGSFMEVDTNIHSQASADYHLNAIKEFSPFNEYFIGEKLALFGECGTGTQIYIWNLDKWGSNYTLDWVGPKEGINSPNHCEGDILIRSRRIRTRPGQISREVLLDYSLQSYLEVIFLVPRMRISIQGSLVKSRPLAKSLSKTCMVKGEIVGRDVELTLGYSHHEWQRANCGIFLYWHGRLIEAYKRVGGMVHNADMGRGVIGVIDVTDLMDDDNGQVMVLNNKQGFQDCELYAKLEEWLGNRCDEYWDNNFDKLSLRKSSANHKPDHEWVQCDKCRKWRVLSAGSNSDTLPSEWFCYMPPFCGNCEIVEQKVGRGVITVGTKRSGTNGKQEIVQVEEVPETSEANLTDIGDDKKVGPVETDDPHFLEPAMTPYFSHRHAMKSFVCIW